MPASKARAEDIASRLSALGLTTRVDEHAHYTSIESEVPESLPAESWREVLEVVAEADRFGLLASSLTGRTLWAAVRRAVPATGDVRGPGHQQEELISMSNRTIPTAARTSGHPLRPALPLGVDAVPYRSSSCAIGTHRECAHSSPGTAPVDVPVIYEACDCLCHDTDNGSRPRRVTP